KLGSIIDTYYIPGVNGATLNSDNTLTPDTSTKYILDFTYDNTDETLCKLFIDKKLHIVEIPIYSSAVSVSGSTLTAKLTGEFKLPVKGAEYSVSISEGSVIDSVGNGNVLYTDTETAPGVEKPEIRIQKNGYEISWTNTSSPTTNSDVTMPETASMKISCRTPGATIKYSAKSKESDEIKVNDVVYHNTKTGDVEVSKPTDNTDAYTQNTPVTLGSTISNNKFSNAKGLKIAIAAYSKKGDDQEDAYEYAARTVLKFEVNNNFYDNSPTKETNISENNTKLNTNDLKVWVTGGDASSGDNTIETFPLSWRDFSKFKLMKVENNGNPTGGNWYWITWDLSAPAYHGFVAGDVPLDANDNGPTTCYPGQCTWNPLKSNYVLHPGETLRMQLTTGHNNGGRANYYFAIKNEITRN
ncbi:MAG: hypothetical protein IJ937_00080, partial [Treponema sp.]|nr:hypothetical protein [Treponema sp.]